MKILRILNNNAVLTLDEQGREKIVCGKGIAYKKKIGDMVPENTVNKVFLATDQAERKKLTALLSEIPLEHIHAAACQFFLHFRFGFIAIYTVFYSL